MKQLIAAIIMKNIIYLLSIILILCFNNLLAQDDRIFEQKLEDGGFNSTKNNEVRIDLLNPFIGIAEATYERLITPNKGIGLSVSYAFNRNNWLNYNFKNIDYTINPYYRLYFGKQKSSGFYLQGDIIFFKDLDDKIILYTQNAPIIIVYERQYGLAIGGTTGVKLITQFGWHLDTSISLSRSITHSYDDKHKRRFIFSLDISVGKRFW